MTGRGQRVADADRDVRQYLVRIAAVLGEVLGDKLAGLYIYGSLATGSYHRERSDIDLIAVVSGKLSAGRREAVARALVQLSDARPTRGDIEVHVVQERYARSFEHPMPYEVHYSARLHEDIRRGRFDFAEDRTNVDLAASFMEARERGVNLLGPPPQSLFGPVPWHAYINALEADFLSARRFIMEKPVYAVLNACRILHETTSRSPSVLNKDEAATWALENVPRMYHSIVNDALQLYRGTKSLDDVVMGEREIVAFREYVRERSRDAFSRASDTDEG
jgi:predicted nucleotidyltransferase